jgi:hypothetical protein
MTREAAIGQGNIPIAPKRWGEAVDYRGSARRNPDLSAAAQPALDRGNFSRTQSYSILSMLQECHA